MIEPIVGDCVEEILAIKSGASISALRESALELASNNDEQKWIQKQLHGPTLQLRKGQPVDTKTFLDDLQGAIERRRKTARGNIAVERSLEV